MPTVTLKIKHTQTFIKKLTKVTFQQAVWGIALWMRLFLRKGVKVAISQMENLVVNVNGVRLVVGVI